MSAAIRLGPSPRRLGPDLAARDAGLHAEAGRVLALGPLTDRATSTTWDHAELPGVRPGGGVPRSVGVALPCAGLPGLDGHHIDQGTSEQVWRVHLDDAGCPGRKVPASLGAQLLDRPTGLCHRI